ncbi:MAG TPA: hypothetical protein DCX06_09685 [Opitutae bacterium]|nr:hypothetical protein [Opitutae bacterium]
MTKYTSQFFAAASLMVLTVQAQAATHTWVPTANNGRWAVNTDYWDVAIVSGNTTDVVLTNGTTNPALGGNAASGAVSYTVRSITFDNGAFNHALHLANSFSGGTVARDLTFSADSGNATLKVNSTATGNYVIEGNTGSASDIIMASSLDVIHDGSGTLTLGSSNSRIEGGAGQTLTKSGTGTLVFAGANTYIGNTVISAGTLNLLDNAELSFSIGATGVNNQVSGAGVINLDGDFRFDLTSAGTTIGNSWNVLNIASLTETFGGTFQAFSTLGSFTNNSGIWSITENGADYEFSQATGLLTVVPEPSAYAMLAGLLSLSWVMVRRRK